MNTSNAKRSRRLFLLSLGVGTAAGAAALAARKEADPAQSQAKTPEGKKGYQLTEHVRNYYRTAKI